MKPFGFVDESNFISHSDEQKNLHIIERIGLFSTFTAIFIATLGWIGWIFNIPFLRSALPNTPTMRPTTATALLFLSIALLLVRTHRKKRILTIITVTLAISVLLQGLLTISFYLSPHSLRLNRTFLMEESILGLPSPESSLCLTLLSFGLLLYLSKNTSSKRQNEFFFLISGGVALLSLTGHLTGARVLYSVFSSTGAIGMALNTSLALLFISVSGVTLNPQGTIISLLTSSTAGGEIVRRILPMLLVAPILIETIAALMGSLGLFEPPVSRAFSLILMLGTFLSAVWTSARTLDQIDREKINIYACLKQKEESYRSLIDLAPDAIFTANLGGQFTHINEAACRLLGYSHEEILGKNFMDFILPNDVPRLLAMREYLKVPGNTQVAEWWIKRSNGTYMPIEVNAKFLPDGRWQTFVRDITERKRAEELLIKQSRDLQTYAHEIEDLYNNAPCGYHSIDSDGTFIQMNNTELRWLGYSRMEVIRRMKMADVLTPESQKIFSKEFPGFIARGSVNDLKIDMIRKDGSILSVLVNATAIKDSSGKYLLSRSSLFDYSAQKKLEQELKQALSARDEFLSIAAHDLKTPLTSLSLQIQLLQKVSQDSLSLEEAVAKHVQQGRVITVPTVQLIKQARGQIERLVNLMNDLLDLTRIRVGHLTLNPKKVDLVEVVKEAVSNFEAELQSRKIQISILGETSLLGDWDPNRMNQIVTNLISNAIKYGKDKPIEIHIQATPDHKTARMQVKDQGIGIAPDFHGKIFERYERASESKKIAGLGLGLYITSQAVAAHGGRIWVESKPDHGSTFTVELPLHKYAIAPNGETNPSNLNKIDRIA